MTPPPWRLRAVEGLADSLPSPAGLLLGAVDDGARAITLLGAVPAPASGSAKDVAAAAAKVLALLPQGVHITGCYGCTTPPPLSAPGAPPVGHTANGFTLGGEPAAAEAIPPPPTTTLAPPGFTAVRCRCDALLRVAAPAGGGAGGAAALARAFAELQQQLAGPGLAFISEQQSSGSSDNTAAPRKLLTASSSGALQAALPAAPAGDPCTSVSPLSGGGSSGAAAAGGSRPAAPAFAFEPAAEGTVITEVVLGLDVLALLPSASDARAAPAALAAALGRQLETIESDLAARLAAAGSSGGGGQQAALVPVRAYHFRPPGWALPVTICYPRSAGADESAAEAELLQTRRALHALLGLPDSVPMLRFANALAWGAGGSGAGDDGSGNKVARLRDVHIGVTPPSIAGSPVLIRGSYEYYHYMQDRFNDSGWGCAYRSLQTIVSWFRQQRYTSKPVPSHREIQSMLVKLGDKEPSFIGSSQWIGAIELGYILEEYLGVTSKIMTVSRGADIPSHARELAAHFETQGTPVMIGGGVLAYTLLGVQFDELTGRAAFLILDPHYTGGEDLKKVQQGTWVAWKMPGDNAAAGGPLYVDDTFYNFLLPQRPATV